MTDTNTTPASETTNTMNELDRAIAIAKARKAAQAAAKAQATESKPKDATVDEEKATKKAEREAAKAQRDQERADQKAKRDAAREAKKAEKAAAKGEKDSVKEAEKAAKKAEKEAARALKKAERDAEKQAKAATKVPAAVKRLEAARAALPVLTDEVQAIIDSVPTTAIDAVIAHLTLRSKASRVSATVSADPAALNKGDTVTVNVGKFAGQTGTVTKVGRVRVHVAVGNGEPLYLFCTDVTKVEPVSVEVAAE